MPELPEVETICRGLKDILSHQPILEKVELRRANLRYDIPLRKIQKLEGQRILEVGRRAKYLWFRTTKGYLVSHLGMTGSWRPWAGEPLGRHDHVVLQFSNKLTLVYKDPRRFGLLDFSPQLNGAPFSLMGPEPFSDDFSVDYLVGQFKGKLAPIKNALMDQRLVVGIGNIYASEILFEAKIKPQRVSHRVTRVELDRIIRMTHLVLSRAIAAGGSTLRDFQHMDGATGDFQNQFKVYGRDSEKCWLCDGKIKAEVMAGRNTFWCSKCQC